MWQRSLTLKLRIDLTLLWISFLISTIKRIMDTPLNLLMPPQGIIILHMLLDIILFMVLNIIGRMLGMVDLLLAALFTFRANCSSR